MYFDVAAFSYSLLLFLVGFVVIIIFVCVLHRERASRLLVYTLSFTHFCERARNDRDYNCNTHTHKKEWMCCVCLCAREPTSVLIPFAILAFSFQLNNLKGLFGAFALLFSHFHGLILSIAGWNHCSRCYSCIVLLFCFCFCKRCRQWNV